MHDFYVNVVDFFSVILPGMVVSAWFLNIDLIRVFLYQNIIAGVSDFVGLWALYFALSYLSGQFILVISIRLEWIYDAFYRHIWSDKPDGICEKVRLIKQKHLNGGFSNSFNTYKWAKSFIYALRPGMIEEVQRHESESRLFRSISVLLGFFFLIAIIKGMFLPALILFLLFCLSLWHFWEVKNKALVTAYENVITLDALMRTNAPLGI